MQQQGGQPFAAEKRPKPRLLACPPLPAPGPLAGLKKFKHLAGNFGGAWYKQKSEFSQFPGPVLMTTK